MNHEHHMGQILEHDHSACCLCVCVWVAHPVT